MPFGETKIYFDGSHYIAIPHTTRPSKKRYIKPEETITVIENEETNEGSSIELEPYVSLEENINNSENLIDLIEKDEQKTENKPKKVKTTTKKELFDELYSKYIDKPKRKRKTQIIQDMLPHFQDKESCFNYVQSQMERKQRNLICRRVRMIRKANLVNFNYFCTFTYDDKLHAEQTFKKKLQGCFKMMCHRKAWKYMGVWERAPKTNRLHFHGLFQIPEGSLPGTIKVVKSYSTRQGKIQYSYQSSYFNERFGRTDFKEINTHQDLMQEIQYICKYIEKTEEKIVYSKGLYQFFISDIMDEDIVCTIGQEDKKLLLFDDFNCWDEGVLMGKVSAKVIEQLRKSN